MLAEDDSRKTVQICCSDSVRYLKKGFQWFRLVAKGAGHGKSQEGEAEV